MRFAIRRLFRSTMSQTTRRTGRTLLSITSLEDRLTPVVGMNPALNVAGVGMNPALNVAGVGMRPAVTTTIAGGPTSTPANRSTTPSTPMVGMQPNVATNIAGGPSGVSLANQPARPATGLVGMQPNVATNIAGGPAGVPFTSRPATPLPPVNPVVNPFFNSGAAQQPLTAMGQQIMANAGHVGVTTVGQVNALGFTSFTPVGDGTGEPPPSTAGVAGYNSSISGSSLASYGGAPLGNNNVTNYAIVPGIGTNGAGVRPATSGLGASGTGVVQGVGTIGSAGSFAGTGEPPPAQGAPSRSNPITVQSEPIVILGGQVPSGNTSDHAEPLFPFGVRLPINPFTTYTFDGVSVQSGLTPAPAVVGDLIAAGSMFIPIFRIPGFGTVVQTEGSILAQQGLTRVGLSGLLGSTERAAINGAGRTIIGEIGSGVQSGLSNGGRLAQNAIPTPPVGGGTLQQAIGNLLGTPAGQITVNAVTAGLGSYLTTNLPPAVQNAVVNGFTNAGQVFTGVGFPIP